MILIECSRYCFIKSANFWINANEPLHIKYTHYSSSQKSNFIFLFVIVIKRNFSSRCQLRIFKYSLKLSWSFEKKNICLGVKYYLIVFINEVVCHYCVFFFSLAFTIKSFYFVKLLKKTLNNKNYLLLF